MIRRFDLVAQLRNRCALAPALVGLRELARLLAYWDSKAWCPANRHVPPKSSRLAPILLATINFFYAFGHALSAALEQGC